MVQLKSKIHNIPVTEVRLDYEGSVLIGQNIMIEAGLARYEQVILNNQENGTTWTTYCLPTNEADAFVLCGGAARHGKVGDRYVVLAFEEVPCQVNPPRPSIVRFPAL